MTTIIQSSRHYDKSNLEIDTLPWRSWFDYGANSVISPRVVSEISIYSCIGRLSLSIEAALLLWQHVSNASHHVFSNTL